MTDETKNGALSDFIELPDTMLDSPQYAALNPYAVKLLIDIVRQYNGCNNGGLYATWKIMQKRGWKSRDTLTKSINALLNAGFIIKTKQRGRSGASLYAIPWEAVNECEG